MKARTGKRGRFIAYDKQLVLYQIVQGRMSAQEIADKHGITRDMVYSLKHAAKKRNLIQEPAQRLADLDPIQRRRFADDLPNRIYQAAIRYRDGEVSDVDFYQQVRSMLEE